VKNRLHAVNTAPKKTDFSASFMAFADQTNILAQARGASEPEKTAGRNPALPTANGSAN